MKHLAFFLHYPKLPEAVSELTIFETDAWMDHFFTINFYKFKPSCVILFDSDNIELKKFIITEKIKGETITVIDEDEIEYNAFLNIVNIIEKSKNTIAYKNMIETQERLTKVSNELRQLNQKVENLTTKQYSLLAVELEFSRQYFEQVQSKLIKLVKETKASLKKPTSKRVLQK